MSEFTEELFKLQDEKYGDFQAKLMPQIARESVIGVRTPELRKLAKRLSKEPYADIFLNDLPHKYYEENNLHAELIKNKYKDYAQFIDELEKFLPYIDNWATCDMLSPKLFKKHPDEVYERIKAWIESEHAYTVRFAIVTLLGFYLDEEFKQEQLDMVVACSRAQAKRMTEAGGRVQVKRLAEDRSRTHDKLTKSKVKQNNPCEFVDVYYIRMAVAWYFSYALIKQYDTAIKYIEDKKLDTWTHNMTIQKAVESSRISDETKAYLKTLKVNIRTDS